MPSGTGPSVAMWLYVHDGRGDEASAISCDRWANEVEAGDERRNPMLDRGDLLHHQFQLADASIAEVAERFLSLAPVG